MARRPGRLGSCLARREVRPRTGYLTDQLSAVRTVSFLRYGRGAWRAQLASDCMYLARFSGCRATQLRPTAMPWRRSRPVIEATTYAGRNWLPSALAARSPEAGTGHARSTATV